MNTPYPLKKGMYHISINLNMILNDNVNVNVNVSIRGESKFEIRTLSVNPTLRFDPSTPYGLSVNPTSSNFDLKTKCNP